MKDKSILITGGLGFIFSHVSEYLAEQGNRVTVLDAELDGSHPELKKEWKKIPITIRKGNVNKINMDDQFDIIIHAAAESNVDKSILDQQSFIKSNVLGTCAMLEYARWKQKNLQQFLYVSTDEVFGATSHWCSPETHPTKPTNPYSASKAAGGSFAWAYHATYELPIKEIRMCNIIGRRQATTKLLPRIIECINNNQPLPVYDGGKNTREYMDVRDVGPLIDEVLKDESSGIYNLTFNQEHSILEVINAVSKAMNKKPILSEASRPGHDARYRMKPAKIMMNEVGHAKFRHRSLQETIMWVLDVP